MISAVRRASRWWYEAAGPLAGLPGLLLSPRPRTECTTRRACPVWSSHSGLPLQPIWTTGARRQLGDPTFPQVSAYSVSRESSASTANPVSQPRHLLHQPPRTLPFQEPRLVMRGRGDRRGTGLTGCERITGWGGRVHEGGQGTCGGGLLRRHPAGKTADPHCACAHSYSWAPPAPMESGPDSQKAPALFCPLLSFLSPVPIHLLGTHLRTFLVGTSDQVGATSPTSNSLRKEM